MANPQYRLDEEEKKIIDLIRQHKLDYYDITYLLRAGAGQYKTMYGAETFQLTPTMQRDLDKYTKLLEYLEKGE